MSVAIHARQCQCGRLIPPRHCAACGSTNIYGKESNSELRTIGNDKILLRGFRCRKCLLDFNEGTPCEAPLFENKTIRERREAEEIAERNRLILSDDKIRQQAIKAMFDKKGKTSSQKILEDLARQVEEKQRLSEQPPPNTEGAQGWTETNPMMDDVPEPPSEDDESGKE